MSKLNYNAIAKRELNQFLNETENNYSICESIYSILRQKSSDLKVRDIKNITDEEFLSLTEKAIKTEKDFPTTDSEFADFIKRVIIKKDE